MNIDQIAEKSRQDAEFKKVVRDFDLNLRGILGSIDRINTNTEKLFKWLDNETDVKYVRYTGLKNLLSDIKVYLSISAAIQIIIMLLLIFK